MTDKVLTFIGLYMVQHSDVKSTLKYVYMNENEASRVEDGELGGMSGKWIETLRS